MFVYSYCSCKYTSGSPFSNWECCTLFNYISGVESMRTSAGEIPNAGQVSCISNACVRSVNLLARLIDASTHTEGEMICMTLEYQPLAQIDWGLLLFIQLTRLRECSSFNFLHFTPLQMCSGCTIYCKCIVINTILLMTISVSQKLTCITMTASYQNLYPKL